MLLAIDDTDSLAGGCTTHMAFRILLAVPELALGSMPRLVRLNPNVPHKTRGNAAVVLHLVHPEGPQTRVGELQGREILAFPEGAPATASEALLEHIWQVVDGHAQPDASPAVALCDEPLPAAVYHETVQEFVQPAVAKRILEASGALTRSRGEQALVGCAGALAWPGPPTSFEFIAYRHAAQIGSPRQVETAPLRDLDARGITFHTFDPEEQVLACVPSTPCPVLAGLRGTEPERLMRGSVLALMQAAQEPVDGWLLFQTNQASGDHVCRVSSIREAAPLQTIAATVTVTAPPKTVQGGHVLVDATDALGHPLRLAAFEPTKRFRNPVRALRPGDRLEATGAWRDRTIALESMHILHLADAVHKQNPVCPQCRKVMKSRGKDAGYRCRHGHGDAPESAAAWVQEPRDLRAGAYEVPVMARRHLHRPATWPSLDTSDTME